MMMKSVAIVPSTPSMRMAVPPVAAKTAGIAIVPVVGTVYTGAPTRPEGSSVRMNAVPVVQAANLILPAIIDAGDSTTINVRPRRTIADCRVLTNVDLTNIDRSIVDQVIAGPIADVRSVSDVVADSVADIGAVAIGNAVADIGASRPRKRGRLQRFVHSQKISQVARRRTSSTTHVWQVRSVAAVWKIDVWPITCRPIGQANVGAISRTAAQIGNAGACGRSIADVRQLVSRTVRRK